MVIFLPQLDNAVLTVQLFSDFLICTHELVNLSRELVVLVAHNPYVIVHAVDLDLQIRITFNQRRIRVLAALELSLQIHDLVFFGPDLHLKVFKLCDQVLVRSGLLLSMSLQVRILLLIALLERLQVLELIDKRLQLAFQSAHVTFALTDSLLFLLHFILLLIELATHIFIAI